jgi:hypothetical protein
MWKWGIFSLIKGKKMQILYPHFFDIQCYSTNPIGFKILGILLISGGRKKCAFDYPSILFSLLPNDEFSRKEKYSKDKKLWYKCIQLLVGIVFPKEIFQREVVGATSSN